VTLTTATCAVVYDSTADLPDGPQADANWRMVPLTVSFGAESFRDYIDLDVDEFYRRLAGGEQPTTAQPSPAAFAAVYDELVADYQTVYSLHLSGKLSGTVNAARLAAADWPGRVYVVDTGGASALLAMAVIGVAELLAAGTTPEAVEAFLDDHRRHARCFFSVPALEYLQRGGRIGAARAFLGQMLNVRPVLSLEDGELRALTRVRGPHKLAGALVAQVLNASQGWDQVRILIAHAVAPEAAAELGRLVVAARPGVDIARVLSFGAVIGSHAGPGALGIACAETRRSS
jgi:DegV family protein with EDD domain